MSGVVRGGGPVGRASPCTGARGGPADGNGADGQVCRTPPTTRNAFAARDVPTTARTCASRDAGGRRTGGNARRPGGATGGDGRRPCASVGCAGDRDRDRTRQARPPGLFLRRHRHRAVAPHARPRGGLGRLADRRLPLRPAGHRGADGLGDVPPDGHRPRPARRPAGARPRGAVDPLRGPHTAARRDRHARPGAGDDPDAGDLPRGDPARARHRAAARDPRRRVSPSPVPSPRSAPSSCGRPSSTPGSTSSSSAAPPSRPSTSRAAPSR